MKKIFKYFPIMVAITSLLIFSLAFAAAPEKKKLLYKPTVTEYGIVDGNRIFNYLNNSGAWCTHNCPVGFGMQWPGQSGHSVDYASGIWVAGLVDGEVRTAVSEFAYEFNPGNILPDGTADDPTSPRHQILKINKADLLNEGFDNSDYDLWVTDLYQIGAPVLKAKDGSDSLSASGKRIPAMIGDQMLWMVFNDLDASAHTVLSTLPIGIEVQNTVWVFNRPDAFGDMMFLKFLIINKGQHVVQDAFIGFWFDIDLGDSNDDLVFCDTTLSLAAFWNDGIDTDFDPCPAVGADFFQGPIVPSPGDTANVSGVKYPDYKNLGMTSFAKYVRGGASNLQDPETGQEAYNFMLGLDGLGAPILNPVTGQPTVFVNISDPETGTGWVDGVTDLPADRRMLMNTGPFTLDTWVDTNGDGLAQVGEPGVQELVGAFMIAQGTSAVNSCTRLKQADASAQLAYDLNFALPPSPPNPAVTVHALDRELILTWGEEIEDYTAIDRVDVDADGNPTYYTFQGYNIYQTDAPTVGPNSTVLKLATFDVADGVGDIQDYVFSNEFGEVVLATVQKASDAGIQRSFRITTDALGGGVPLSNWNNYWFIVTGYGYNPDGLPKVLESPYATIAAMPQQPEGGMQATAQFGDLIAAVTTDTTFNAEHTTTGALSDGQLEVEVVDATQITGKDYRVIFELIDGATVWHAERKDGEVWTRVLANQTNQAGDNGYTVVDGLMIKSIGPEPNWKSFQVVANANGPINPPEAGAAPWTGFPVPTEVDPDGYPTSGQQTTGALWLINVGGGNGYFNDGSGSSFVDRSARNDNFTRLVPYDYEMRFTTAGGMGIWAFEDNVQRAIPFELWNIGISTPDDPSDDYRMIPGVLNDTGEAPADGTYNINATDHPVSGGDNDPYMDWVYWYNPIDKTPGSAGYEAFVSSGDDSQIEAEVMARTVLVNWNGGSVSDASFPQNVKAVIPETGTIFRMTTTKPNSASDIFTFSTTGLQPITSNALAKADAKMVNVFPNPYFGQNRAEVNPVNRFVTLTHLPQNNVTIRVFTIAGSLVRTLNDETRTADGTLGTNTATWDLRNEFNVPVASGIYIIHVDLGNLGEKMLKIAVFMPEERLDKF